MIPKKIHYCWLSGEEIPEILQKSMSTWKKFLPDYELILWDKNKFDINSVDFVKEAVNVKKWAFAADYIRLHAVYTQGGIYMDTDVIVKKNFDKFLEHDFFSAVENDAKKNKDLKNEKPKHLINAAIFGSVAGHSYLKNCMDWYKDKHFILPDGSLLNSLVAPDIYTEVAEKYGFSGKDELQKLSDGMVIYSSKIFSNNKTKYTKETFAIHWCYGNWRDKNMIKKLRTFLSTRLFFLKYFMKEAK
jgi:mannosyltransferase OCH1-like enzyme